MALQLKCSSAKSEITELVPVCTRLVIEMANFANKVDRSRVSYQ